ncbi:hypothetical protein L226DRAFT_230397 [Lentinus tigrinus ALCF2SS1-7]|uniref:Uncharacterized protein n=1 Tax=Lentinus tigrinus ALCF2SS1-6 TaxID=1328759 RepID=A0A5C2RUY4_9APHY|nr:hypothetical protein L227DRAFT_313763 [Lentinus tigrinus ALCF2SS1-6]RPD70344.1 hypothetical protein L226DRAFT_230397 [Lentinus tigrinus ALCF2SS1-7]
MTSMKFPFASSLKPRSGRQIIARSDIPSYIRRIALGRPATSLAPKPPSSDPNVPSKPPLFIPISNRPALPSSEPCPPDGCSYEPGSIIASDALGEHTSSLRSDSMRRRGTVCGGCRRRHKGLYAAHDMPNVTGYMRI